MPSDTYFSQSPITERDVAVDTARLSRIRDVLGEPEDAAPAGGLQGAMTGATRMVRNLGSKRIALILGLLFVLWLGPLFVLLMLAVLFWIPLAVAVTVGPSKVWNGFVRMAPRLAERMRRRIDAFAPRYDAFLDRLPFAWAEHLYLPDLSQPIQVATRDTQGQEPA